LGYSSSVRVNLISKTRSDSASVGYQVCYKGWRARHIGNNTSSG